ncbi:MAG: hypothetical protein FWG09_02155, partial [Synergistaceae bacterium]|nr:hypothetical protein [Synergistaceae bacterium]
MNKAAKSANEKITPDETSPDAITQAMEGKLTQEQQAIIEKFDKEASTRTLENPIVSRLFYWSCVAATLYHFITSYFGTP